MPAKIKRLPSVGAAGLYVSALAAVVGSWTVGMAGSASAALPSGCSETGRTVTCTYAGAGTYMFSVPTGVSSLDVIAVGAAGGSSLSVSGGAGASVEDTSVSVSGSQVLRVVVGGVGGAATFTTAGAGGTPGGGGAAGVGEFGGGGGGGYSGLFDPSNTPLVVAAGGGGGGGSSNNTGGAGDTGNGGGTAVVGFCVDPQGGPGGGASGGTAGTGGAGASGGAGSAGSSLAGGQGGAPSGAGGGGGYAGGGGGGGSGPSCGGGGGGGSSFGISGLTNETNTTSAASVKISYAASVAQASPAIVSFPTQPQSTLSAPQAVTLTNTGGNPLIVHGLTFAGTDPHDYVITSNDCLGEVAPNESCQIGVSFAPQEQGASSASLQIASNDPSSPASVGLSGIGGQLPQGPAGSTGANGQPGAAGQTGATGATGPQGAAGKIELVVCHKVTKTTITHGKKHKTTVQHCRTRLVSGVVKFTIDSDDLGASVSRAGITYATGIAIPTGTDRWQLMLTHRLRKLRPGRYTLTLRSRHGGRRILERRPITIT